MADPKPVVIRYEMNNETFYYKLWKLGAATLVSIVVSAYIFYAYRAFVIAEAIKGAADPMAVSCALDDGGSSKAILCNARK